MTDESTNSLKYDEDCDEDSELKPSSAMMIFDKMARFLWLCEATCSDGADHDGQVVVGLHWLVSVRGELASEDYWLAVVFWGENFLKQMIIFEAITEVFFHLGLVKVLT